MPDPSSSSSRGLAGIAFALAGLALLILPVATLVWAMPLPLPNVPEVAAAVGRIASVLIGANLMGAAWVRRREVLNLIRPPN